VEFLDIDPQTYCLDINKLETKLKSSKPGTYKGVVSVDFAGYPVDLERLRKIADDHGLWILEDACHAIGAQFKNSKGQWSFAGSGDYADISVFSFHPVKHIATGEGGMVTTANKNLWDRVNTFRTHGIIRDPSQFTRNDGPWYHEMHSLGYNYRIPDILCALGLSQMSRITENLKRRREIASTYYKELEGLPITLPVVNSEVRHAYHLFVIQTEQRRALFDYLKSHNIHCQVHYIPVHTQPYYTQLCGRASLPAVEKYYERTLSLPMFHSLSEQSQAFVIEKIKAFFKAK
jgi:dTDP-4-amino-4,6-dideoxygalactose transaminase